MILKANLIAVKFSLLCIRFRFLLFPALKPQVILFVIIITLHIFLGVSEIYFCCRPDMLRVSSLLTDPPAQ